MACRSSVRDGQQEPEQHRADHRSEDRRRAAEDEGAEREERLRGGVEVGVDRLGLQCVEHAAEPADHAAEDQRLHLVDEDVLAECACGVLVLADGLEDTAPRTVRQEEHEPAQHQDESPSDDHRPEVVTVELHAEEVVLLTRVERAERGERVGETEQAVGGSGDRIRGGGPEDQPQDLGRGDRDDGEVVGPQPQRRDTEDDGQQPGRGETDEDADPQRLLVGDGHDPDAVAAEEGEPDLTEVQQSGVAEVQVEADRQQRVEDRGRADQLGERDLECSCDVHALTRSFAGCRECPEAGRPG